MISVMLIILGLFTRLLASLVRFVDKVRGVHLGLEIALENDENALILELVKLPRKDRSFTCDDLLRFYNNNLDDREKTCVLGQLLRRRIEEIHPVNERIIARWKRAVGNVRALTKFLPPPLKNFIKFILDIMDIVLKILESAFPEKKRG